MERRTLGTSAVQVTPIAYGAWAIGGWMWGGADEQEAIEAIKASLENGITTIDTAPVYGFGRSEELVGKALEGVPRDQYELLTKFGLNWETAEGEYFFDTKSNEGAPLKIYKYSSKKRVIEECEASLKRLRTDYIDLLQIHWPDATTPVAETMEALAMLQQQGKIRAGGVCNYNAVLVSEALSTYRIASNQVPYSMLNRDIEAEVVPQALKEKISIIAYSPLQRGLLTGKIKRDHVFGEGDSREGNKYYTPENIDRANAMLAQLRPIAEGYNATLAQLVLNWTMNQPAIGCVLAGARNAQQVKDNAGALRFKISGGDMEQISGIVKGVMVV